MANKTRTEIQNQIYEYIPQVNHSGKTTLVNNLIDLAVENISREHDFRCLRSYTPDTATLAAGGYYIDLSSFTVMGAASTYLKDILQMRWMRTGTEDYGTIVFVDDTTFHQRHGYIDYASRDRGKPCEYTRLADRFLFNCPADESLTIRCWYQKLHPPFASDATSHSFSSSMNLTAFMAIVYGTLVELKASLTSVEFPQELQAPESIYQKWLTKLIAADKDIPNESIEFGWGERTSRADNSSPYSWV